MEDEVLLAADEEGGAAGGAKKGKKDGDGLWGRAVSMFSKDKGSADPSAPPSADGALAQAPEAKEDNSKIHIFSVASGHLYERFLKIMILSVLRQTKTPVKFWFISNYMSPSFKQFLPEFAAEYKFDYGLITYKWPTWLNKQTEKQRIIWAYKVLFLDVLFPLSLDRVIFVDADQIVRADMKELMSADLKGAPYAYTPMCDNNKEMEGYRFWKQARVPSCRGVSACASDLLFPFTFAFIGSRCGFSAALTKPPPLFLPAPGLLEGPPPGPPVPHQRAVRC